MPYLNVATHIDDFPYDKLLQEKGFRGYPSLAFMDAEGNVIGQPGDRSVTSFHATRDALGQLEVVREKAEAGDTEAQVELVFLQFTLGTLTAEELAEQITALAEHATPEQLAEAKQIALDDKIYQLYVQTFRGDKEKAMGELLGLLEAGELPTPGSRSCSVFWSGIAGHAHKSGDSNLLMQAVAGMRSDMAGDTRSEKEADRYEGIAESLRDRDGLLTRKEGGEANLDAKILLLEVSIEAVELEAFQERLEAAMAVATDAEKIELRQAGADLELNDIVARFWAREEGPLVEGLLTLLEQHDPAPSEDLAGLIRYMVSDYVRSSKDADDLDAHATAIDARYGDDSPMKAIVKTLREGAEKLRE